MAERNDGFDIVSYLMGKQAGGGGGGGSNWTLLASEEYAVNTTSTSATAVASIKLPEGDYGPEDIIWVHIRDKAGKRNGYFFGHDGICLNYLAKRNATGSSGVATLLLYVSSEAWYVANNASFGVYVNNVSRAMDGQLTVNISARYSSGYGIIGGTYKVEVYKLTPASGMKIFD